ncbi:MAG: hypothetical protein KDC07_00150, partial [Chitinophagaceae bacterium]|nr:hypothetical protein [Chitinophagaceae bacterium]
MKRYILFAVMILAFAGQGCTGCSDNNNGPADDTTGKHTGATGKFLMISDIHFNPYCDSKILPQLVKADYTDWPTI